MTFFWRAWLKNYKPRHWQTCIEIIRQLNKYYKRVGLETQYSIVKEPDIAYLIEMFMSSEKGTTVAVENDTTYQKK